MKIRLKIYALSNLIGILILLLVSKNAIAQDTIVQTNGNKMVTVVQEVGTTEIKYKKYETRQTSPVYTINRKAVSMIKYADGTKDEFIDGTNVKDLPPPVNHEPPAEPFKKGINKPAVEPFKEPLNKPTFKQKYVYFGIRASLLNDYSGGNLNSYWTALFAGANDGAVQLNTGYPSFNEFVAGNTFPLSGNDQLNIEVQLVLSHAHALNNTAIFIGDGTNGDIYFDLFGVNLAAQYLRSLDPAGKFQVGAEFGIDYGMLSGSEHDVFNSAAATPQTVDRTYDGSGFGAHFCILGKYFLGAKKMFGVEVRAGYRALATVAKTSFGLSTYPPAPDNQSLNIGWNGAFATVGVILQFKKPERK